MNLSLLTGARSGLSAAGLVLLGLVILLLVSVRLPFVIRRPGKGRIAKGLAAGSLVLVLLGAGLFLAADLTDGYPSFRHGLDALALPLVTASLLLATLAGWRAGRRRATSPSTATPAPAEPPPGAPPDANGTAPPRPG